MQDRDPNIVISDRSQTFTKDGITVEVRIYRLEDDPKWTLKVVNEDGTSIVWTNLFDSDEDALDAFEKDAEEDWIESYHDDDHCALCAGDFPPELIEAIVATSFETGPSMTRDEFVEWLATSAASDHQD